MINRLLVFYYLWLPSHMLGFYSGKMGWWGVWLKWVVHVHSVYEKEIIIIILIMIIIVTIIIMTFIIIISITIIISSTNSSNNNINGSRDGSSTIFIKGMIFITIDIYNIAIPLRWRHNDHAGVSNHQPHGCLLNRLFRRRSKKTSKLRVTGLCAGHSPGSGEFPAQMASYAENVSIWWRHHEHHHRPRHCHRCPRHCHRHHHYYYNQQLSSNFLKDMFTRCNYRYIYLMFNNKKLTSDMNNAKHWIWVNLWWTIMLGEYCVTVKIAVGEWNINWSSIRW